MNLLTHRFAPYIICTLLLTTCRAENDWSASRAEVDRFCNRGDFSSAYVTYKQAATTYRSPESIAAWARIFRAWTFAGQTKVAPTAPPMSDAQRIVGLIESSPIIHKKEGLFLLFERYRLADAEIPPPKGPDLKNTKDMQWVKITSPDGAVRYLHLHVGHQDINADRERIRRRVLAQMKALSPDSLIVQYTESISGTQTDDTLARSIATYKEDADEIGPAGAWWIATNARKLHHDQEALKWFSVYKQKISRLPTFGQRVYERLYATP